MTTITKKQFNTEKRKFAKVLNSTAKDLDMVWSQELDYDTVKIMKAELRYIAKKLKNDITYN